MMKRLYACALLVVLACACASGQVGTPHVAIQSNPAGPQTTTQLNSVFYVNPGSSVDLVTQVNALATACAGSCMIRIPANPMGCYVVASGTILLHQHGLSLVGDGKNNTCITYAGTNFLDQRLTGSDYDLNYGRAGEVGNFTINCTNPAAICMSTGSQQNAHWHDLYIVGPGGPVSASAPGTSQGIVFQNTYNWMERSQFHDVTVAGFAKMYHFMAPTGSGTDSFGYGEWTGLNANQCGGCTVWQVDSGASVYHTKAFSITVNNTNGAGSDYIFNIAGDFDGTAFSMNGEGPATGFALVNGSMRFDGFYNTFSGGGSSGSGQFIIGPGASSTPVLATLSSVGTIAAFGGSAETVSVYPYVTLDGPLHYAPASIAGFDWLQGGTPTGTGALPTSWMLTHDAGLMACIGVMSGASSGQTQLNAVPEQCFDGTIFRSPEAVIGDITIGPYDVNINSGPVDAPNLTQTAASTYGMFNEVDATQGNWWWGVESNFQPNPGWWYFETKGAAATVVPPLQINPAGGISAPAVSTGSTTVYRCTTAGTSPIGTLTTVAANCGASVATNLTVN